MPDGWLSVFDAGDKATFTAELRGRLNTAEQTGDYTAVEKCIRDWQVTGRALADPKRREVLAGTHRGGDFTEVGRPHA